MQLLNVDIVDCWGGLVAVDWLQPAGFERFKVVFHSASGNLWYDHCANLCNYTPGDHDPSGWRRLGNSALDHL